MRSSARHATRYLSRQAGFGNRGQCKNRMNATRPRHRRSSRIELTIDSARDAQQLGLFHFAGQRIAEFAIEPIEDAYVLLLRKPERRLTRVVGVGAHV